MGLAYAVESHLPGRIRLRSEQLRLLGFPKAQVENFFLTLEGIRRVRYTPAGGTLTLHFDAEGFDTHTLFTLLDSHDRGALRDRIAAFEAETLPQNEKLERFALHSTVLASLLLRRLLPPGFYAAAAVWLGWGRLTKGARSLMRLSWDEQLLEGAALAAAIATRRPVTPLLLLWLDSAEMLLVSRLQGNAPLRPAAVSADDAHLEAVSADYARADDMVLPAVAIAGLSYGISEEVDRSAAILSINRHKGVRLPERFAYETAERMDAGTSLRAIEASARFNLRAADIALLSAAVGLLPPTASTLIARSARIFTVCNLVRKRRASAPIHDIGGHDDNQRRSRTA